MKISKKEIIGLATCFIVLPLIISVPIIAIRVKNLWSNQKEEKVESDKTD